MLKLVLQRKTMMFNPLQSGISNKAHRLVLPLENSGYMHPIPENVLPKTIILFTDIDLALTLH